MNRSDSPFPPVPAPAHVKVMRASRPDFVGVFVEGPSDVTMWRRWLRSRPVSCGGKREVHAALMNLSTEGVDGCVGIVDADFDRLEGILPDYPDLVLTENHDMEGDLACSPALETLLSNVADDWVARLPTPRIPLRDALGARALPFGLLRWVFRDRKEQFPEGRLGPYRFVDEPSWSVHDEDLQAEAARVLCTDAWTLREELTKKRKRVDAERVWFVCNGHDVIRLVRLAIEGPLGGSKAYPNDEAVAAALQNLVDSTDLAALSVWRDLGRWEERNPGYRVRNEPRPVFPGR